MVLSLLVLSVSVRSDELPYPEVTAPFQVHQVSETPIYYVLGTPGVPDSVNQGHTSNAGFVITDDGVVVYDALGTPALGYRLLQAIRELTDQPVRYVIAGHYHADHIYGLQAFAQHSDAEIVAQSSALQYLSGDVRLTSESADQRLEQRREALFPWVDEDSYVVTPDRLFERQWSFELGGIRFKAVHLGPAHAPSDSILIVENFAVVFSGDLIYRGRVPYLDSPEVKTGHWLEGLDYLLSLDPPPRLIIPGHGDVSDNPLQAIRFTRDYLQYLRDQMAAAVADFIPFDEAYDQTDWSAYQDLPAFNASNRGNAYRVYLEMEAESLKG